MSKLSLSKIIAIQPAFVAFPILFFGFILVAVSFFWDLGSVKVIVLDVETKAEIVKEVGYGSAINWTLTTCLLLPAAILYLFKSFRSFHSALCSLTMNTMLLKGDFTPVAKEELLNNWKSILNRHRIWLFVLITIGLLFSLWEWFDYSCYPLFSNDIKLAVEWDWSVGALLNKDGLPMLNDSIPRFKNALLSFCAFLNQAIIISVVAALVYQSLIAASFFSNLNRNDSTDYYLIPDPTSDDRRKGFEHLSQYVEHLLLLVSILYTIFYTSRLQNIYLRSKATSLLEFIKNDLIIGLTSNPWDIGSATHVLKQAIQEAPVEVDYSSIMVSLAAFGIMLVAAYVIGTTLRETAKQSKQNLEVLIQNHPEECESVLGLSTKKIRKSMKDMVFWPVNYIKAGQFFGLIFLGVFCIIFYRIGVVLISLLLLRVFWEVSQYIIGRSSP